MPGAPQHWEVHNSETESSLFEGLKIVVEIAELLLQFLHVSTCFYVFLLHPWIPSSLVAI